MKIEEEIKKILHTVKLDKHLGSNGKKMFLVLAAFAIIAIIFWVESSSVAVKDKDNTITEEFSITETVDTADNEETTRVEIDLEKQEDKIVLLSVDDYGRANPFLPASESISNTRKYGIELMAPPETLTEGSEASKIVSTKVSGIMYDDDSPVAILNIENSDYLVRSGDYINNYKVLSIGKDLVTVQLGSNVYKARVGEVITGEEEIKYNDVYNLENKFGGARK